MADTIEDALDLLGRNDPAVVNRLPPRMRGTVRLDVLDDGRTTSWFVLLDRGKVQVSSTGSEPDSIIRSDRTTFDRLARGDDRFIPLLFRNSLVVEGDLGIADQISRALFADAPSGQHPRDFARKGAAEHEREDRQHPGREHVRRH
ncbi:MULTISPECIES: SCP2 sterol-binding domain-containing protein [unclassified Solwaraspora]|uniref:SCP2 sterol-binding domain-containing protein n=1 Tax=unclassified Solwaraspora TaxID=2627926 RepID=UPI00259B8FD6|nr:SCP2 sterol-binding domain-containing protein [Solwaraspora sp. WMMA2056]WJK39144.1 SCP2 sterol-binding domain-containing protein [Solwaraspora sp. WMMA2056]